MAFRQSLRAFQAIRPSVPTASYRPRTWQAVRFYSEAAASETPASAPYLQHLKTDLKTAMRAKDAPRLAVLRAILSANLNASKTKTPIRTDPQLVIQIMKMKRSIEETAAEAKKVGREDLAEKELEQAKLMEEYIVKSKLEVLGEEQLRPMIKEQIELSIAEGAQTKTLMPDVIKRIKAATEDKVVESKILAPLVKELINERNK
uniref:Altered inheritance of mitochondria protein 41 n=1 Tax=Bionectria ochroleuca TaxID=29856 RepID=A0A8H7NNE6_BIOOC